MEENNIQPPRAAFEPMAVDLNGLRHLTGHPTLSAVTAWRLEKRRLLKRVPHIRRRLYTTASVRAYIEGKAN